MKIVLQPGPYILTQKYGEINIYGPFKSIRAATIWGNKHETQEKSIRWSIVQDPSLGIAEMLE